MAGRRKPQRDATARGERLSPKLHLLTAILRQVLADAQSPREPIRAEAQPCLQSEDFVEYWDSFLGLGGALHEQVHHVLRRTHQGGV